MLNRNTRESLGELCGKLVLPNFHSCFYLSNEHFFRVYIASSKHEVGWENSTQFCKPEKESFPRSFLIAQIDQPFHELPPIEEFKTSLTVHSSVTGFGAKKKKDKALYAYH